MQHLADNLDKATPAQLEALCRLFQSQNLVPHSPVFAKSQALAAADTSNRIDFTLTRGPRTKAFAAILKVRTQLTAEANDYVVYFLFNSPHGKTDTLTALAARNGQWIATEAAHTQALPAWLEKGHVDLCALQAGDFATRSAGEVSLVIYEMVSAVECVEAC